MDFERQRGFLLDGEDPPENVGCTKESYFLAFMYVDVARDCVVVFHVLFNGAKGSHNQRHSCCFELTHALNLGFQVFVFAVVLTEVLVSRGTIISMRRQVLSFLFFSTLWGGYIQF